MRRIWDALAHAVTRRTGAVLALAVLATAILAIGIPRLGFETSQDSLIGEDSEVAIDNRAFQDRFGGEPMLVLFTAEGDARVESLFAPDNLERLQAADESLRASGIFHAVQSPLAALQLAANQVGVGPQMFEVATERAGPAEAAELEARLGEAAARLGDAIAAGVADGIEDPLSFQNPAFVRFLLYEDEAETSIRPVLRDNFPDPQHALSIVRLQGNVDIAEMGEGADLVRNTYEATDFDGFTTLATGPPVLLQDINDYLQGGMATLGALAVGVMLLVLFVVFRVRWRLLSLSIVVLGALWAFGIMGYLGIPLTLITISGLPILIGVGVDFSIQMHSRFEEEIDEDGLLQASMTRVMRRLAPPLMIAMTAAVVGFLALQLSEVPQIRDFGMMLAIGIAALFVAGIAVPTAILSVRERRRPTPAGGGSVPHGALERLVSRLSTLGNRAVAPMLVVGVLVIVGGLAVEGRFTIQTDPERWVPQGGDTVASLEDLRDGTGFSSELSLLVTAPDVLDDEVVAWMYEYGQRQATEHPEGIVRATSFPAIAQSVTGATPGRAEVELLLDGALDDPPSYDVAPRDLVVTFVSPDRTAAAITFPIAPLSLDARADLLDAMIADLDPPPGVEAEPAGIAVVGVELVDALEANRSLITWMAVAAVALLLLLWFRSITKAVLPLIPVLIAVGLSSLVVFVSGLELSPLTSVTGPLVIATCTEFSVLILSRYIEEREGGRSPEQAVEHGAVRIGRAFTASGLTTVGGFGVLALSAFPLLRDFGILVAVNVLVALITALVVLPPLLVWADRSMRIRGFTPGSAIEPTRPVVDLTEPQVPTPTGVGR